MSETKDKLTVRQLLRKTKKVNYRLRPAGPRCVQCGRQLTSERSVSRGIGPSCLGKLRDMLTKEGLL